MIKGICIMVLWIAAGVFSLIDAFSRKGGGVEPFNYIICWVMLLICLFYDYILKI